jgi:hypothetical protein
MSQEFVDFLKSVDSPQIDGNENLQKIADALVVGAASA